MIDLHIHTNYSDGTWNLRETLEAANNANLEIISITDHDTVDAYKELEEIKVEEIFEGRIISGIEFTTIFEGTMFHLLAYDFDYKKLEDYIFKNYKSRKPNLELEFEYMINSCKKNNIKMGNIKYDKNKGWPVDLVFTEIKKYKENKKYFEEDEWNNIDIFFNSCATNKKFPAYVDFSIHYPKANELVDVVREAGGKTFIAHVFRYNLKGTLEFLDKLNENNIIDGIEVYYSDFTNEQIKILEKYCRDNKLLMSGGSDCHGEKKLERKIGIGYNNLNIRKEIINNWNLKK